MMFKRACPWPVMIEGAGADSTKKVPMTDALVYSSLFAAAFLAATILPAQSEALLAGLLHADEQPALLLITVASVGNVLGSVANWLLGRGAEHFAGRRWFPVRAAALERAKRWYRRWGRWSLLLSWTPIVGDPITVAAGILREPLPMFLLLVTVAKVGRYLVVAGFALRWI